MRICVLCSSFNRSYTTIAGLTSLSEALEKVHGLNFTIFLLDDASTDGTAEKVHQALPSINIINGTGSLFWNRGMIAAYAASRNSQHDSWDAYLLFNDDTHVNSDGVQNFMEHYIRENKTRSTVCVGRLVDPETGITTYGGYRRLLRCQPLRITPIEPTRAVEECDTFNGNFVLIPSTAFDEIGGLCPEYWHSYGDIDVGYTLTRQGSRIILVEIPIGTARRNPPANMSTVSKRYRRLFGKPNSVSQIFSFYRRNGCTINWWLFATAAIIKKWLTVLTGRY